MLTAPILITARLTLSPHTAEDFADSAAMWGDKAVVRPLGASPSAPEDAWRRLLAYAGHWALMGYGYWTVRETASGRFVGEAGLADYKRELHTALGTPFGDAPEVGWALATWAHGLGYGREAVGAVLAWADGVLAAPRIVCLIGPDNAPSIRLAEAVGFVAWAETDHRGRPARLFERLRPS